MYQIKLGLLPFYLKLYDDLSGEYRSRLNAFIDDIALGFRSRGLKVDIAPICRISSEFASAVRGFEENSVDAIVTLHLAYSPSLESSTVLARTHLPIIVFDTTPTWSYGPTQDPVELMYNHGIHGVQDMCNLLVRNGKNFAIEAGHWEQSDVMDRIVRHLPAAKAASIMGRGRVGIMGSVFKGMGDFATTPERLASTIGGRVVPFDTSMLPRLNQELDPTEIAKEIEEDLRNFVNSDIDTDVHARSVRLSLVIDRWIKNEGLHAFTFNFQDMVSEAGFPTVPFLAASKAMARGIGYAGEGDVMTALLVAAVFAIHPESTFTEMFCPDWKGGNIFLSHMGEMNWRLVEGKPTLREMKYEYGATGNPAFLTGRFREGDVILINLAPISDSTYRLILAPGQMFPIEGEDHMDQSVHGWFRPTLPISDFLEEYSILGGTHHIALAYTNSTELLLDFAIFMGWETKIIK